MAATVTINDVLDGHVVLDIECLESILRSVLPNRTTGILLSAAKRSTARGRQAARATCTAKGLAHHRHSRH